MRVRVSTVRFKGSGSIDCRICSHKTVFPDNAMAIVYNLSGRKQVILSASDRSRLHVCGYVYVWVCVDCGHEPDQEEVLSALSALQARRARGRAVGTMTARLERTLECPVCGSPFQQRSRMAVVHS